MKALGKRLARRLLPTPIQDLIRRSRTIRSATPAPPAPPRRDATAEVALLEDKLWLGYTRASLRGLEEIWADSTVGSGPRSAAALVLGEWHLASKEPGQALDWLTRVDDTNPSPEATSLLADCLLQLGRPQEALLRLAPLVDRRRADPSTRLRIGWARAVLDGQKPHGSGALIETLNHLYVESGLTPIYRRDVHRPPSTGNLGAEAPKVVAADAPLVSVIVHQAEPTPPVALESLVRQSWSNLEIIVVQSGPVGPDPDPPRDPRIVFMHCEHENPYRAWNQGAQAARGAFLMVHEPREWSHPQRLEATASALLARPNRMTAASSTLRVDHRFWLRYPGHRPTPNLIAPSPSLMVRREVLEVIGGWDEVPACSEDEFVARAVARFGADSSVQVEAVVPLSIGDPGEAVSNDSHALGYVRQYREAFTWWHQSPSFSSEIPLDAESARPFPVPGGLGDPQSDRAGYTTVVMGDLSELDEATDAVLGWATDRPGPVAVAHVPGFGGPSRPAHPGLYSLARQHGMTLLAGDAAIDCEDLVLTASVVTSPHLEGLPDVRPVRAYAVGVATATAPSGPATEHLRRWIGVELEPFDLSAAEGRSASP